MSSFRNGGAPRIGAGNLLLTIFFSFTTSPTKRQPKRANVLLRFLSFRDGAKVVAQSFPAANSSDHATKRSMDWSAVAACISVGALVGVLLMVTFGHHRPSGVTALTSIFPESGVLAVGSVACDGVARPFDSEANKCLTLGGNVAFGNVRFFRVQDEIPNPRRPRDLDEAYENVVNGHDDWNRPLRPEMFEAEADLTMPDGSVWRNAWLAPSLQPPNSVFACGGKNSNGTVNCPWE
jgi:hypothetical protein